MENDAAVDTVECYSGHTYAGEPRAVLWRGERLPVERVTARWRTPSGPTYRVEVRGGHRFELHYDDGDARWSVGEIDSPGGTVISSPDYQDS